MSRRLIYIATSLLSFVLCALIVMFWSHHEFIRGFIGDVIVIVLIYCVIKSFKDIKPVKLSLYVFILSWIVELSQYIRILEHLGLSHYRLLRIVVGATFDYKDLIAYTVGTCIIYLLDITLVKYIQRY